MNERDQMVDEAIAERDRGGAPAKRHDDALVAWFIVLYTLIVFALGIGADELIRWLA